MNLSKYWYIISMRSFILFFLIVTPVLLRASNLDSLLSELDQTLKERNYYVENKKKHISFIHDDLSKGHLTEIERYDIQRCLFLEYKTFIADSALHYADENLKIAIVLNNQDLICRAKLDKVNVLIASGLFVEAMSILKQLSSLSLKSEIRIDYYVAFENLYLFQAEYSMTDSYETEYLAKVKLYRDSILALTPSYSYQHIIVKAPKLIDEGKFNEAIGLLKNNLLQIKPDTRDFAVATSILAFAYHQINNPIAEIEARINSAKADIKGAVKENYSLCALAQLLFEKGDLERANRYIKLSLEDASIFSTRLRSLQISKLLPIIDYAYQEEEGRHQSYLKMLTIGVSLLSLFLLMTVFYIVFQMRRLSKTRKRIIEVNLELNRLNSELEQMNISQTISNDHLVDVNRHLTEANHVKEEYLGRFLSLNSYYISRLDDYRKILNRLAADGKLKELYRMLKSDTYFHQELKNFYHDFDVSFLKIYPHFVSEFNLLLPKEEQIYPKKDELLTTELRIFALIRLGINDSARIAEFLRCSITTIYTYRSKLKKKSLCKEEFESKVMAITSF